MAVDNVSYHTSKNVQDKQVLSWSPSSPGLVEHLWEVLEKLHDIRQVFF